MASAQGAAPEFPKGRNVIAGLAAAMAGNNGKKSGMRTGVGQTSYHYALPAYLGGQGPGGWASNHYAEAKQVTGWAFCAVRAIARTVARSIPQVMATGPRARKMMDKAVTLRTKGLMSRSDFRAVEKSLTNSSHGDDALPMPKSFPLTRLLRRPNPFMSGRQFLFQVAQQHMVTGTAMLWVRRNGYMARDRRGVPRRLYCVPTGLTVPLVPSDSSPWGAYRVMPVGSYGGLNLSNDAYGDTAWTSLMLTGGVIDGREIRNIRWPHPLFLTDGLSNMAAGELWIDMANQLDRATWYGFKNTLRPGRIFGMDGDAEEPTKEEAERFDAELKARAAGIENIGNPLRLPKGVNLVASDTGVQELDYVQGRKNAGDTVLALFSTPPVATGVQEAGAYAAYYASLLQFTEQAISPLLGLIEDEFTHELAPAFGPHLEVKLPTPPINDGDEKIRTWSLIAQNRSCTHDEFRKAFDLKPWGGQKGGYQVGTDWAEARWNVEKHDMEREQFDADMEAQAAEAQSPPEPGQPPASPKPAQPPRPTAKGGPPKGSQKSLKRGKRFVEPPGFFKPTTAFIPEAIAKLGRNGSLNGVH